MNDATLERKLENNPLTYRDKLTIPSNINFGLELELDNIKYYEVYKLVKKHIGWNVHKDKSLTEGKNAEINSPVLQNTKPTWILLKKLGNLLQTLEPTYNNCSFQVNFDGNLLPTLKDKVNFLKLYAMYEDIIYRFSKGEDQYYRDSLETYASPIIFALKGVMRFDDEIIIDMFSNNKRYGIVFKMGNIDLIEFRTPNMTSNPILWQNYITTFYYLIECASKHRFNNKEVEEYIDKFQDLYVLENYDKVKKQKSLTFSQKIFKNSIDRYNFTNQYFGKDKNK